MVVLTMWLEPKMMDNYPYKEFRQRTLRLLLIDYYLDYYLHFILHLIFHIYMCVFKNIYTWLLGWLEFISLIFNYCGFYSRMCFSLMIFSVFYDILFIGLLHYEYICLIDSILYDNIVVSSLIYMLIQKKFFLSNPLLYPLVSKLNYN